MRLCALLQRKFEVVAVTFVLEHFKIAARSGDQTALNSQITYGALQLGLGGFEVCLCVTQISFHTTNVRFYAFNAAVNRGNLLFLLFRDARFSGTLITLQLSGTLGQFSLG